MVHQYKNNGYAICMDVNSGFIHVVEDIVYDMIPLFPEHSVEEMVGLLQEKYPEEEIRAAAAEIQTLKDQGQLFAEDIFEEYIQDVQQRETFVKALCLHVAHDCNLSCAYCFANEGKYHQQRELMSFEVGKQALDFLIRESGSRKNLEVDFFGGEPLMNFEVVKQLVAYGRAQEDTHNKKFRFTLTTNGVLLDEEKMAFANQEMDNVVLSIDGRREVHDAMRPFPKGKGSYDLIVPKFLEFVEKRGWQDYYVRGTYTRRNLDFSKDVLHLADLGFSRISVEPVVADPREPYALRGEDVDRLLAEYDALAREMLRREQSGEGFLFFHFMIDLEGGPCVAKRLTGCGAGSEYLAVTPWGDLYPCHQFVGNSRFLLGNVREGIRNQALQETFLQCNVYAKEACRDCFAKLYCSGGCAANAYHFGGDITGTYEIGCMLQRKRVECAIMLKAAMQEMYQ